MPFPLNLTPGVIQKATVTLQSITPTPDTSAKFKLDFSANISGLTTTFLQTTINSGGTIDGFVTVPVDYQPPVVSGSGKVTLTPVLYQYDNGTYISVTTQSTPHVSNVSTYNNSTFITPRFSPYLDMASISSYYDTRYLYFWSGKKAVTLYFICPTYSNKPITSWGTYTPNVTWNTANYSSDISNLFTAQSWSNVTNFSLSTYSQKDVINISIPITPVELTATTATYPANSVIYAPSVYYGTYYDWLTSVTTPNGSMSTLFYPTYVLKNLVVSPTTVTTPIAASSQVSLQIAKKLNTAITINLNNTNLVFYDATTSYGFSITSAYYFGTTQSYTILPDGTTDEVCIIINNNLTSQVVPNITITESAYTLAAPTTIANNQTLSGSGSFNTGPADMFYGFGSDLYQFTGSQGQVININMTVPGAGWYPRMLLLDSNKNLIFIDDGGVTNGGYTALLSGRLPSSGTYYIQCTHQNGGALGTLYNVTLTLSSPVFALNTVYNSSVPTKNTISVSPTSLNCYIEIRIDGTIVTGNILLGVIPTPFLTFDKTTYSTGLHNLTVYGRDFITETEITETYTFTV